MSVLLGIDLGTSATKAVLVDDRGRVISAVDAPHPLHQPRPGWTEQEPEDWWQSTVRAVHAALAKGEVSGREVIAIGLSGQMHGSVFIDKQMTADWGAELRAMRPALLWNDQRTSAQCAKIEEALGGPEATVALLGNRALPGFQLPKILWLREHEPHVFNRVGAVVLPKDYLRWRMIGLPRTDPGDASGTLLFDVKAREFSARALEVFGLAREMFPLVYESCESTGKLTPWAAIQLNLSSDIPVVAGSGDNMCGAVGAGVIEPGQVLATLGTSGVIYAHTDAPRPDLPAGGAGGGASGGGVAGGAGSGSASGGGVGRFHAMCAGTGSARRREGWCMTGCTLSAGGSLQWVRDTLFPNERFEALLAEAERVPAGCDGLAFLPYLTGERCPHPDASARGGWVGLSRAHTRGHLVRAVLEGVVFTMGEILDLFRGAGLTPSGVRLSGGMNSSTLVRQMQADVYALPVEQTTTVAEGPAYGAALMAGVGAGVWRTLESACRDAVRVVETREPYESRRYDAARAHFASLYPALRERFAALGAP